MKKYVTIFLVSTLLISCSRRPNIEAVKNEILQTEKAFEKMAGEKGLAEAFYFFASEDAVILRGNDSIISGRNNIKLYYEKNAKPNIKLTWAPDFIGISGDATLGYTYGKYKYVIDDRAGKKELKGVFHTVWKKENNGWRYVWD